MSVDTARLSSQHNRLGKPGGPGLFGDKSLQLPAYIQNIAKALIRQGKPKSQAIQIAIGTVKKWAAGGGGVGPEVKAAAAKAVAEWEAAKAKAHATPNKGASLSNGTDRAERFLELAAHALDSTPRRKAATRPFESFRHLLASGRVDLAAADVGERDGMIALEVPAGTLAQLPGGLPQDDMHVTLAYLGDDVSDVEFARALSVAYEACDGMGSLTGMLGGLGVFPAQDGKVPVWCPVDVPGLDRLARRLGGLSASEHGFTPHITLTYQAEGAKLPPPVPQTPVMFTHVVVARGSTRYRLPLDQRGYRSQERAYASSPGGVELSQIDDAHGAPAKSRKPPKDKQQDKGKGKQRYKHGWIPVDENGKATGPAQKPAWLLADEKKHLAAGGKTAGQLRDEAAAKEFKSKREAAARPAKEAAAKKKAVARKAEAETRRKQADARRKKAASERTTRQHKAAADRKARERDALVSRAYRQALADLKAGRTLSEQQQRVVAHVRALEKKDTARLRKVDVPGAKVAVKATPAKVTVRKVKRKPVKVRMRSYRQRAMGLAGGRVNALEFSAAKPAGQLAFRYKHGWILINPAISARKHGGAVAVKFGHKSGTVTHGHFEDHPSGKGKIFVPEKTGKPLAQAAAEAKLKKQGAGKISYTKKEKTGADQKKYALVASKGGGGTSGTTGTPTAEQVSAKSTEALAASVAAKQSGSVKDAQIAAKKHADAFVIAKKAGDDKKAAGHKNLAQDWAKKAQELKKAGASGDTMNEALAAAKKEHVKENDALKAEANKAYQAAVYMPDETPSQKEAKAAAYMEAAKKYEQTFQHAGKYDLESDALSSAEFKTAGEQAAELEKAAVKQNHDGALYLYEANAKDNPSFAKDIKTQALAKGYAKADEFDAIDKKHAPAEAETETPPVLTTAVIFNVIDSMLDDIDEMDSPASRAQWDDFLSISALHKKNPTAKNLKDLAAAQKTLTDKGVTLDAVKQQNAKLFKELGLGPKKPAAKKAAAPSKPAGGTTDAEKIADAKAIRAEFLAFKGMPSGAAKSAAFKDLQKSEKAFLEKHGVPYDKGMAEGIIGAQEKIILPGPGMAADGKALEAARAHLEELPVGSPEAGAFLKVYGNAVQEFKLKHGVDYDPTMVGSGTSSGYVSENPNSFDAAKKAGFQPVSPKTSANGTWRPAQVPGLKSNTGAHAYSGSAYAGINSQLRRYKKPGGKYAPAIAQMDREFAAVPPLTHNIAVSRSLSGKGPFPEYPPPMDAGAEFIDHGYSSTSKEIGTWSGNTVLEIRVPKGAKVLDLNHTTGSLNPQENEILLNRRTRYRVISDGKSGYKRTIVVEVVV